MPFLYDSTPIYTAGQSPDGMTEAGNIDLASRPRVPNEDGSISTVRSMSIGTDKGEVLIPTVGDEGAILSDADAVKRYQQTGKHLGVFESPEAATSYAETLHNQQEDFYSRPQVRPAGLAYQTPLDLETHGGRPAFTDLLSAAWHDTGFGAAVSSIDTTPRAAFDPNFDPFSDLKGYEDYAESFLDDNTPEEVARTKAKIDGERKRSDLLASGGVMGIAAELAAGIADPINLIPIGDAVTVGKLGYRALAGAARAGAGFAAATATDEALAQRFIETRTGTQSAINIAASAFMGGVLGGATSMLSHADVAQLATDLLKKGGIYERETAANDGLARTGSVGAAAARDTSIEQETLTGALGTEKALAFAMPTMRTANSESVETRRIAQDLAEQPLSYRKNEEGIATPVAAERLIRMADAPLAQALEAADDAFVRYRLGRDQKTGDLTKLAVGDLAGRSDGMLSNEEFMQAVGRAMRRDDQHPIPEVAEAAKAWRDTVFDPMKNKAIELGLLPEDVGVDTAASYLMRLYDREKIVARRPDFETRITDWLGNLRGEAEASRQDAEKAMTARRGQTEKVRTDLDAANQEVERAGGDIRSFQERLAPDRFLADADKIPADETRYLKRGDTEYVGDSAGNVNLGVISPEIGQAIGKVPAPIRLPKGIHDEEGEKFGGEVHIEASHGDQIRATEKTPGVNYTGVADFVADVARNFNEVRETRNGGIALIRRGDGISPGAILELKPKPEGNAWEIASAFPMRAGYMEKEKLLWSSGAHPEGKSPSALGNQGIEKNIASTVMSGNVRETAAGAERELKFANRDAKQAEREAAAAAKRADRAKPTDTESAMTAALRDLKKGVPEPETLAQWLRRTGGLQDSGGELANLGIKGRAAGGLLKKDGRNLDDAALAAWEQGFFPSHDTRPDINDFLAALHDDFNKVNPVYRDGDYDVVAYRDYLKQLEREVTKAGHDLGKQNPEAIAAKMEGDRYVKDSPANRAKSRESEYYKKRADEKVAKTKTRAQRALEMRDAAVRTLELHQAHADARARQQALRDELAKAQDRETRAVTRHEDAKAFPGLTDVELKDIARQITDKLLSMPLGRIPYEAVPLTRGPLRERTLSIPDRMIEDYLDSDIRRVGKAYTRTMATDLALTEKFGRADMRDQIENINEEYARLREGVTDEKRLKQLDGSQRDDIRDLGAIRDRLRGTYALPENPNGLAERIYRVVKDFNYLRLLGGMTVSSLPDPGRIVMEHGLTRFFGDGFIPMVKNFAAFRLSAEETKMAGTALDMILDTRVMSMADVLDDYGRHTKFERGIQALTSKFGLVSLMAPWNSFWKQFTGMIGQTRLLEATQAWGRGDIKPAEKTRLASLGVNEDMAARIADQYQTHGKDIDGIAWANTSAWTDQGAAAVYRAALAKEVDAVIITPGQEKPLWMSKGMGRVIGQFRSFSIASTQRVMMSGLQRRDMAALNGMALMWGLGALVYYMKNPDKAATATPAQWAAEGLDRSGLTGWLYDANNIVEKWTGGSLGVSRLTGAGTSNRYASRGVVESLVGPSAGLLIDSGGMANDAFQGKWGAPDTAALRRMIPAQNLIGVRRLFDAAEDGVNSSMGLPTKH